jgi:hypothetical protein
MNRVDKQLAQGSISKVLADKHRKYRKNRDKRNVPSLPTAVDMYAEQGYVCKTRGYRWFMQDKDFDR